MRMRVSAGPYNVTVGAMMKGKFRAQKKYVTYRRQLFFNRVNFVTEKDKSAV